MRVTAETKLQTDRAIRDAARRLFAGKGFEATSTREIAKEAGIAIGTLFNYYRTKENLALDLIDEALEIGLAAYARRIETLAPATLEEDLFALIAAGLRTLAPARSSVAQVLEAGLSPFSVAEPDSPAARIRTRHLERVAGALTRHGCSNLSTPVAMHLYWSLYLGILSYWAADNSPKQQDSLALIDQSVRMFVEALRPALHTFALIHGGPIMTRMQVHEVLTHLPREFADETPPGPTLLETLAGAGVRSIPIGRFSRFWSLGTLQGKIAAAYAFWWIRGLYRSDEEHERHLNEAHLKAAIRLLGTMSYLRGAVMKLGQVLAHFPGVVPEEFVSLLGRLQFQAPPMHFELLREMVRTELGADPEDIFDDFETEAFAAASLGQVHRARLKGSGTLVAVKVQYPGIARSIGADVANMKALIAPMRLGPDGASITDQLDDIHRMLQLEVDYRAEAANIATARAALADMPGVVVPDVHERFSTSCILTMDFLPGVHLDRFLKQNPTQESRDRFGSLMTRAGMRLCYGSHMLYADLHPGNFIFMPDGRLGLIDFGCCHRYTPEDITYLDQAERAASGTRDDVRRALALGADLTPRQQTDKRRMDTLEAWFDWINEPIVHDGTFDFSDPAYFRRGLEIWGRIMRHRYIRSLPVNIWINKSFLGLRAMLHHLGAHVPLGQILREETSVKP